jgi:hypothetical protein
MRQGLNKIIQLKLNLLLRNVNAVAVIVIVDSVLLILIVKKMI